MKPQNNDRMREALNNIAELNEQIRFVLTVRSEQRKENDKKLIEITQKYRR